MAEEQLQRFKAGYVGTLGVVAKRAGCDTHPDSQRNRIPHFALHICAAAAAPGVAEPLVSPAIGKDEKTDDTADLAPAWLVVCWDDPVNLMNYVTHVFQAVFGWPKKKAEYHMLQVHNNGKSVLARTTMEQAEHYVHQLQKYSLHATMERDS